MADKLANFVPDPKLEKMVFDYETTMRTDFQSGFTSSLDSTKTLYKPKGVCYRIRPAPLKDTHTLTDWKLPNVPFDLFWKNVDVDRVNPSETQKPYFEPVDHEREHAQRTRPRVVITPAAVFDDIEEPERQLLMKNVYMSNAKEQTRLPAELAAKNLQVKAPLPAKYSPTNPLALRRVNAPFVSPEWRMDSVSWDNKCLRSYAVPTREFWLRKSRKRESAQRQMGYLPKKNATTNEKA